MIKIWFNDLKIMIIPHWQKVFIALGVILLISQMAVIGSFAVRNQDEKAVIYAKDNDAGRSISIAQDTRWWNSNHFAPYGPLYYRITHTIASLVPYAGEEEYHSIIARERVHHLSLQLASLVAIYSLTFLLSSILLVDLWQRVLASTLIFAALSHSLWAQMVIRPHPDLVLAFTTGIATWATMRWIFNQEKNSQIWAALAWGVAVGSKATIILFTPAFVFLFFPWKKQNLVDGFKFIGWMFLGYTVIGFPQSLSYFKVLKFLFHETNVTMLSDLGTIQTWLRLIYEQSRWPVLMILFLVLTNTNFKIKWESKKLLRAFLFCLIPTLVLLTRKQAYSTNHFPIPFITCALIGFAFCLRRVFENTSMPLFVAAFFVVGLVPPEFNSGLKTMQICRPEAREMAATISELQANKQLILHDPYVPISMVYPEQSKLTWGLRWSDVTKTQPDYIALNSEFYSRYLGPAWDFVWQKEKDEWPERSAFYKSFSGQTEAIAPDGSKWTKIQGSNCHFELWEKYRP